MIESINSNVNSAVKVHLMGRLGNQLFQYALGRTLADQLDQELILDYRKVAHTPDQVALNKFSIRATFIDASLAQTYPSWAWRLSRGVRRQWRPLLNFFHETEFTYDQKVTQQTNNMLSGFWQSYRYINLTEALLQDLSLVNKLSVEQQAIADNMASSNSVAVHIRRGDYINNPKALSKHGICSLIYYQQAVATIKNKVTDPQFFVFSDDPAWVKQHLDIKEAIFVSDLGFTEEIDLTLIARCKHQIIANSSFSWWGAYLNNYADKIVILPTPWFDAPIDEKDMSPKHWLRLPK